MIAIIDYDAGNLKSVEKALEEGQLEGSLKTVAQGLDEDDNPVIMVVRFR